MSICNHKDFVGTKKCPLCYPDYDGGVGVVSDSLIPKRASAPVHHAKKNVAKFKKGVRFY